MYQIRNQPGIDDKIDLSEKGAANGVCPLDEDSKVPVEYLPDTPEHIDGGRDAV